MVEGSDEPIDVDVSTETGGRFGMAADRLMLAGAVAVLACSVLGFADRWWWRLSMLQHLRGQLFLAGLVVLAWFVLRRSRLAVPALMAVVLPAWFVLPLWFGGGSAEADPANSVTVTHLNIDLDHVEALDHVADQQSEIVFIQEFTPMVADAIDDRLPGYEMVLANPRSDSTHGSAMLVRDDWGGTVFSADIVAVPSTSDRPLILAEVGFEGETVSLLSLHTTRPGHAAVYYGQQKEFAGVAEWSRDRIGEGSSVVIIGDFNTTPYASNFRSLLADGELKNGLRGHGWQTTWPASLPSPLQIPIDLVVHSDDVVMVDAHSGPGVGPDHRPLHIEFVIRNL